MSLLPVHLLVSSWLFVDEVDDSHARVQDARGATRVIRTADLPPGAREGDVVVDGAVRRDQVQRASKAVQRARALLPRKPCGSLKL